MIFCIVPFILDSRAIIRDVKMIYRTLGISEKGLALRFMPVLELLERDHRYFMDARYVVRKQKKTYSLIVNNNCFSDSFIN